MTERTLYIVPEPKQISWQEGCFRLDARTCIYLLPDAGDAEHFAARSLQREIEAATSLRVSIVKAAQPARRDNAILLLSDLEAARRFWGEAMPWNADLTGRGAQAYGVEIAPQVIVAGGQGATALHYAVQTLRQLARAEGVCWPALRLVDWPSLPYRGLMLDVSRGKVPTIETLKHLVDELSLYKANVLQLYTEHTFVFPHHPRIGRGCGSLNADDILELDAYARPRQVELMPNLQSFGHCEHILNLPEYAHLAELPQARWSLCPEDGATYEFLNDLYADLLPAFCSKTFNADCDETWDLGKGRSASAVVERGVGRVYLEHILKLRDLAARYGCRIQIWGDILLHHPELVSELPDDVTLLDWHYEAAEDYPSVRTFAASGRAFWVCPGTSSWNTLFPRIENANGNIRTLARLGAERGAQGLLNTDWGDHGHYQPMGQCWYGYIYGAEQAWSGGMTDDQAFDTRFGRLFWGVHGAQVVTTMRALARLNTLPGMPRPNASNSIYALLDEPLVGAVTAEIPQSALQEIMRSCQDAEDVLANAMGCCRDPLSLREMIYSARMMAYAARKTLACQQIRSDIAALAAGQGEPAQALRGAQEVLRALDDELVTLTDVFREVWLARARRSEIAITLDHFERLRERYAAACAWLQGCLADIDADRAPDYSLDAYASAADNYEILGQGFWRRMRAAGVSL